MSRKSLLFEVVSWAIVTVIRLSFTPSGPPSKASPVESQPDKSVSLTTNVPPGSSAGILVLEKL